MEDANRIFAVRQIAESEYAISCAGAEVEEFEWGKVFAIPGFAGCSAAAGVAGFCPRPDDDVERLIREASKFVRGFGYDSLRVLSSPDLIGESSAARIDEDLYLLDFAQTKSGVYGWVKSQKIDKKPPVEIVRTDDWEDMIALFEDDRECNAETRLRLHKLRDEKLAGYSTWFARLKGVPAGRLAYYNFGVCGRLRSLFVSPEIRRRGVASTMISNHIQLARDAGNVIIGLITEKDNPARFLYTGIGFAQVGEFWAFEGSVI